MDAIVPYAVWAALILVSLGVIAIVAFGLRNLTYGKIQPLSAVVIVVPVIILVLLGLILGEWDQAAIWTVVIMFALAALALLASGLRGLSGF